MNPNNKETTGMQLPPPMAEQAPAAPAAEAGAKAEQLPAAPEKPSSAGQAAPAAPAAAAGLPLPVPPPAQPVPPAASAASATASLTADDDGDLIEKEWVTRAKQIVDRNRNDPYKQSEELTVFKADYMKKRYGKTIKVNQ